MKTALDFLGYESKDDSTKEGGIAFSGELLCDFLESVGLPIDTPMEYVNQTLINSGIEPINY